MLTLTKRYFLAEYFQAYEMITFGFSDKRNSTSKIIILEGINSWVYDYSSTARDVFCVLVYLDLTTSLYEYFS